MNRTRLGLLTAVVVAAAACSIEQDVRPVIEARPTVSPLPTASPSDGSSRTPSPSGTELDGGSIGASDRAADPAGDETDAATDEPSPTEPSPTPSPTVEPSPSPSPSASATPTPSPSPSPSPSSSASPAATASPSPSPSERNTAPIARDDRATVDEDNSVEVPVLANDEDAQGDPLSIASVATPSGGSASIVGDTVRFTPDPNRNGTISFSYEVTDGELITRATIVVEVAAVNDAPTAVDDRITRRRGDTEQSVAVLGNDTDPDGDLLRVVSVGAAGAGSVRLVGGDVRYTPPSVRSSATIDRFTYTIEDAAGVRASAIVTIDLT